MALIKYSPLVNSIRGSISNGTFQNSSGGNIVRNKPAPITRYSQQTTDVRSVMPQVVFAWRNLSAGQKITWKNFLSYSPDYMRKSPKLALSAYSLFVKVNCIRLLSNFSILTDITFLNPTLSPSRGLLYLDYDVLTIDIGQGIPGVDWYYQIRASRPASSIYSRVLNDLRIIKMYAGPNQTYPCQSEYYTAWGLVPVAGQVIRLELRFFSATMPFVYQPTETINTL